MSNETYSALDYVWGMDLDKLAEAGQQAQKRQAEMDRTTNSPGQRAMRHRRVVILRELHAGTDAVTIFRKLSEVDGHDVTPRQFLDDVQEALAQWHAKTIALAAEQIEAFERDRKASETRQRQRALSLP